MSSTRISETIPGFNTYINNTGTYVAAGTPTTNGARLGLSPTNITDWENMKTDWIALYAKYSDPLQSTAAVKEAVKNFMKDFKTFAQPLLNIMAASPNAVEADEAVFNFKIGRAVPSHSTTPISEVVVFDARPIGGGELKFSCRTAHDDHRASKAEGADSVQLAYMVVVPNDNPTPPPPGGGDDIPTPNTKGMAKEVFTKSQFTFHAGVDNVGKRMVVFARWWNTKHPELAGPWSPISIVVIA